MAIRIWNHRWGASATAGIALLAGALGFAATLQAAPQGSPPPAQLVLDLAGNPWESIGSAVAVDGDTAVVGSPFANVDGNDGQGAAHVFVRDGDSWVQQARLVADDPKLFSNYARALAIEGDTVVVGATGADGVVSSAGAAYIFTRSGTTWTQQAKLVASDGEGFSDFAAVVDISGDSVVVGSPSMFINGENVVGAAYVFVRDAGVWAQQQKLVASDGLSFDSFGNAVTIDGDSVVVGAHQATVGGASFSGAAYVFQRSGAVWTEAQKLVSSDLAADDGFGSALALEGDDLVVGARQPPLLDEGGAGAAYVFVREAGNFSQQARLLAADGVVGDSFGVSVAIDAGTVLVGAPLSGSQAGVDLEVGSVYVFGRAGTDWTQTGRIRAIDGESGDFLGGKVALSGGTAIAGAPNADVGANDAQGKAYVFALGMPQRSVTEGPFDFGQVAVGETSSAQVVTIRNLGTADFFNGGLTLIGANPDQFAIANDGCAGLRMQPADSCSGEIVYAPQAIASHSAQLVVPGSAGVVFIDLAGEGITPPPQIEVTPNPVVQSVDVDATAAQTLTVSHPGADGTLQWQLTEAGGRPPGVLRAQRASTVVAAAAPRGVDGHAFARAGSAPEAAVFQPDGLPVEAHTLTHSASEAILGGNSVMCANNDTGFTNANQILRTYTLDDFGVTGEFSVDSVRFAVETLTVAMPATVNLYTLDGNLSYLNMTLLATTTMELQPQSMSVIDVPIDALVPAGSTLVLEVATPSLDAAGGVYLPGSNSAGQTAPSYLASQACGAIDPTDAAEIGAPGMHLVMSVSGTSEADPADCSLPTWLGTDIVSGSLQPGASEPLQLQFDADGLAAGDHEANLCFASNAADALYVVPVTLTVTDADALLSLEPATLEFGKVAVGASSSQVATLQSSGDATLQVDGIGIATAPFALTGGDCPTPPFQLAPEASCTLEYTLQPSVVGPVQIGIEIASNAAGGAATLTLQGNGVDEPLFADGFEGID